MRALVLPRPGDLQGLAIVTLPDPQPDPAEVVVRVRACGLCHHDLLVVKGALRRGIKGNLVLGHEIAGEVVEVGSEVQDLKAGDRVVTLLTSACGLCEHCRMGREHRCLKGQGIGHSVDGGFAEYVKLSAFSAVKVPRSIPFEEACILGCPIGVAYRAMKGVGQLHAGETVLVTGAGGGLGSHSVQISKALGARVLAVTTSSHKVEALSRLGADHVLLSPGLDFHWEVLALTEERGVDLVVDTVGSLVFQPVYESLGQFGRWVLIGQLEGQNVSFNPAIFIFKDLSLLASSGVGRKDLRACVRLVQGGKLTPQVTAFPLEEAKRALELLGQRQLLGRAVLTP